MLTGRKEKKPEKFLLRSVIARVSGFVQEICAEAICFVTNAQSSKMKKVAGKAVRRKEEIAGAAVLQDHPRHRHFEPAGLRSSESADEKSSATEQNLPVQLKCCC